MECVSSVEAPTTIGTLVLCGLVNEFKLRFTQINFKSQVLIITEDNEVGNNNNPWESFAINTVEARNEPNVMTGTFLLNDQYVIVLFDSGVGYSLIATTFMPYLDISLSPMSFVFEIEMVNGELTRIDQVVRDCTPVLNKRPFLIDLIPYETGSFDVIVGMNRLSAVGAEIECTNKVVRIPLPSGEVLRVQGKKSDHVNGKVYNVSIKEVELRKVPIVRDFPDVFLDDLPGCPHPAY